MAPANSTQYSCASARSSTPKKVDPMPMDSDFGIGLRSVTAPITGCNKDAVT